MIIAIDPGPEQSAIIHWATGVIVSSEILSNQNVIGELHCLFCPSCELFIEMIASYGMPVGKETFETCVWIGRFIEAWHQISGKMANTIYRKDIKLHHCASVRAKDANVRQALIDKYGAKGTKKNQGVTYGLNSHLWAAFALATYASEKGLA